MAPQHHASRGYQGVLVGGPFWDLATQRASSYLPILVVVVGCLYPPVFGNLFRCECHIQRTTGNKTEDLVEGIPLAASIIRNPPLCVELCRFKFWRSPFLRMPFHRTLLCPSRPPRPTMIHHERLRRLFFKCDPPLPLRWGTPPLAAYPLESFQA